MLDAIRRVTDDSIVFQQDTAMLHLAFVKHSPTATVQNGQLLFS